MKLIKKLIGLKVFKLSIVILLQLIGVFAFVNFASHRTAIYNLAIIINICISISLLSKDDLNPVYKIMWILILSGLPVIGTVIYLLWGDRKITRKKADKIFLIEEEGKKALRDFPFKVDPENLSGGEKQVQNIWKLTRERLFLILLRQNIFQTEKLFLCVF